LGFLGVRVLEGKRGEWGRWWRREEGGEMTLGRGEREREREKKKMNDDEEEAQWWSE